MRPSPPVYDVLKSVPANWVLFSHAVAGSALGVFSSDLPDLIFGQDRLGAIGTSAVLSMLPELSPQYTGGMKGVFGRGAEFEVLDSVIVLDPVPMIDHSVGWNGSDEKLVDETVNLEGLHLRRSRIDAEDVVSVFVDGPFNDRLSSPSQSSRAGHEVTITTGNFPPLFYLFHMGEGTTGSSNTARAFSFPRLQ